VAGGVKPALRGGLTGPLYVAARGGYTLFRRSTGRISRAARPYLYAGSSVECPFCKGRFRRFLPTGVLERPFWKSDAGKRLLELDYITVANLRCPRCGSSERHRLAYYYLKNAVGFDALSGIKLLDVGPDEFVTRALFRRPDLDYTSVDLTRSNATHSMDVTDLSFDDSTFDCIICYHVLEHVPDDGKAIAELFRVMKPGGWGILQVPIWADRTYEDPSIPRSGYLEHYGHRDHVRRYGPDYKTRLEVAGFDVTLDDYVRRLPRELVARHGLLETEDVYVCRKPEATAGG
jgi:SAM-dependent methyltransferase